MRWGLAVAMLAALSAFARPAEAVTGLSLDVELVASGLGKGVKVTHADDDRLFVVDRGGLIRIVRADGSVVSTPFLNIASRVSTSIGEGGLLGLAFHPNYQNNGRFYVHYTTGNSTSTLKSVIARYNVSGSNPDVASTAESRLMVLDQPSTNHNGGDLAFHPNDGYLYITLGDGGGAGDTFRNGQDTTTPLGTVLRIDIDSKAANKPSDCSGSGNGQYKVPTNNPLRDGVGQDCDEIWSYGLRNPYRFSFDRQTGDMFIGDVGQGSREEVNFQAGGTPGGENFGWRCYEGNSTYDLQGCGSPNLYTDPFYDYNRTTSQRSVIGGYSYRGSLYPSLNGVYLFNDYFSTKIWAGKTNAQGNWVVTAYNGKLPRTSFAGWGEDVDGELYIINQQSGELYRVIDDSGNPPPNNVAPVITQGATLSRTMDEDGAPAGFSATIGATDDAPLNQLSWQLKTQAAQGIATVSGSGASPNVDYQPADDYNGTDTFVVEVEDNGGLKDSIRVNVTVRPRNDAPSNTQSPSVGGTAEVGESLTANPGTWNDNKDSPPGTITFTYQWQRANNASGGGLTNIGGATGAGYVVKAADADKYLRVKVVGQDNGTGLPSTASRTAFSSFTQVSTAPAQAPVITQGGTIGVTMDEDGAPAGFSVSISATDNGPTNQLVWSRGAAASNGTATVSGSGSSPNVNYVPNTNFDGSDSFVVRVRDGENEDDTIRVNVTVRPRNDAPRNTNNPSINGEPQVGNTLSANRGQWNDNLDSPAGALTYTYQWQRANNGSGNGTVNIGGATASSYTTVGADEDKFVRVRVTARDNGEGLPATAQATAASTWIKITTEPNEAPVITQGATRTVSMDEDSAPAGFNLSLSATDDGPTGQLSWSLAGAASAGTASVSGSGSSPTLGYSPNANFNGSDSFSAQVADANGRTDQIIINVSIRPRNDAPRNTRLPVINGTPETLARLTLDRGDWNDNRDVSPGNLSYTYRWQVANNASGSGLSDINGAAGLNFDVPANFGGRFVRVHVTVRDDGEGLPSTTSTVRNTSFVEIGAPQVSTEAPVITQGATTTVTFDEDNTPAAFALELRATDDGADSELTWSVSGAPSNGAVTASGNGRSIDVDYVPNVDFNGNDSFDIRVTDGADNSDSIRVQVVINPRNDRPENESSPTIAGIPMIGQTLEGDPGSWNDNRDGVDGEIDFRYQWQRHSNVGSTNGNSGYSDIPGADQSDYRLGPADDGLIRLKVIAVSYGVGRPQQASGVAYSGAVATDPGAIAADTVFLSSFEQP